MKKKKKKKKKKNWYFLNGILIHMSATLIVPCES